MDDFKGNRKLQSNQWYADYYSDCYRDYGNKVTLSLILKQFKEKADYLNLKFPNRGKLLDVGCATGVFLDMMRKQGWDVEGVEISEDLAAYARENFSLKVQVKDLTRGTIDSGPFQVITMFDVIEHIPDPSLMVSSCRELLSDEGLLLVRTPSEEGFLRCIAKAIYRVSFGKAEFSMPWFYSFEHLHSFSLNTLSALLRKHGFSIIRVFREDESLNRLNIPAYVKKIMELISMLSSLLNRQHKMVVIAKKS
jgi:2-polyprenyl-3-methyl-5-hydroxy-6-metoxy-1,4-benzoquinol methylase